MCKEVALLWLSPMACQQDNTETQMCFVISANILPDSNMPIAQWPLNYYIRSNVSMKLVKGRNAFDFNSSVPRVSRVRGQTQFWSPQPARSWQHSCEECVGNKGASKADSGPAIACIQLFIEPSENFLWLWRHRIDVRTSESWKLTTVVLRI